MIEKLCAIPAKQRGYLLVVLGAIVILYAQGILSLVLGRQGSWLLMMVIGGAMLVEGLLQSGLHEPLLDMIGRSTKKSSTKK